MGPNKSKCTYNANRNNSLIVLDLSPTYVRQGNNTYVYLTYILLILSVTV